MYVTNISSLLDKVTQQLSEVQTRIYSSKWGANQTKCLSNRLPLSLAFTSQLRPLLRRPSGEKLYCRNRERRASERASGQESALSRLVGLSNFRAGEEQDRGKSKG